MDRSIELLNDLLKTFNSGNGEYLKLVGDFTKTTPTLSGEVKINDIDTGAISNVLEFTRRLAYFLIDQMDLSKAVSVYLDNLGYYYNISRIPGEIDGDYLQRIISETTRIKLTPLAIRDILEEYGDNVEIIEGGVGGAFSEISFSDSYRDFDSPPYFIKGSICQRNGDLIYFFKVKMNNVLPENYSNIINILNNYRSAGVSYSIEILS